MRTSLVLLSGALFTSFCLWQPGRSQDVQKLASKVGSPVPDLSLRSPEGKAQRLSALQSGQRVVLAFVPVLHSRSECEAEEKAWTPIRARLSGLKVGLLLFSEKQSGCGPTLEVLSDGTGEAVAFFQFSGRGHALVDEDGSLRWVRTSSELAQHTADVTAAVGLWDIGRVTFEVECGHCHGSDGLDMSYPNIKTMAGITRRMDRETILRRAAEAGAVDIGKFSPQEKDGLYLFLSGL